MSDKTKIQWTDTTWNPVTGCSKVSAGCKHCYAERDFPRVYGRQTVRERFSPILDESSYRERPRRFTDVQTHADRLDQPLRWRKPRRVFVNSMSDLFHEDVPDEFIDRVFGVMALAPQHTFQVLTKRPERMRSYFSDMQARSTAIEETELLRRSRYRCECDDDPNGSKAWHEETARLEKGVGAVAAMWNGVALPNVWLGVSAENQETADERISLLLDTPAAVRFVSAEPLLGSIDLIDKCSQSSALHPFEDDPKLDWVIVGGESGPKARACDVEWIRSIVRQCKDAGVACFVKQIGKVCITRRSQAVVDEGGPRIEGGNVDGLALESIRPRDRKGGDPDEWPKDLRVREWPDA